MRKLLYLTYIGLFLPILISCKEENIEPTGALMSNTIEARAASCTSHSFIQKDDTGVLRVFRLGQVRGDVILIGFAEHFPTEAQEQLLSTFPQYERIAGSSLMDSGIIIKTVELKAGTTCNEVEAMLTRLTAHEAVLFANPTFNDPQGIFLWLGLTNEFIVTIDSDSSYPLLERLAKRTNTKIVMLMFDQTYILSADKKSMGNALRMSTLFNQMPYIKFADPNFMFKLGFSFPLESSATGEESSSAENLRKNGHEALYNLHR